MDPEGRGPGGRPGFESNGGRSDIDIALHDEDYVPELCPKCGMAFDSTELVDARDAGRGLFRHFNHGDGMNFCRVPVEQDDNADDESEDADSGE